MIECVVQCGTDSTVPWAMGQKSRGTQYQKCGSSNGWEEGGGRDDLVLELFNSVLVWELEQG